MKINKQLLTQIIKEELQNVLERKITQDELDAMGTLAGAPDPGETPTPTPEQQAQMDQMGTLAPQQDAKQMATKYAKVKHVLAKLVREL